MAVDLEFRPVLQQLPPGGVPADDRGPGDGCATPEGDWTAERPVLAPQVEDGQAVGCFDGAASCPTRQLAIVVDRTVISAPSINAPEFERDEISISGGFTQSEAEALAAGLG